MKSKLKIIQLWLLVDNADIVNLFYNCAVFILKVNTFANFYVIRCFRFTIYFQVLKFEGTEV